MKYVGNWVLYILQIKIDFLYSTRRTQPYCSGSSCIMLKLKFDGNRFSVIVYRFRLWTVFLRSDTGLGRCEYDLECPLFQHSVEVAVSLSD